MTRLIFGCGYLGERVARRWRDDGEAVLIATRTVERAEAFQAAGYAAIIADVTQPATLIGLPAAETVLYAVGFDHSAGQSIKAVYAGGVRNVLAALAASTGRFIYISTTGVYGDAGGEWIDELTPADPHRDGGRASLAAEQAIAASPFAARSIILRLAGIYGPGRIPFLDKLRAGEPIPAPQHGYLNLIHVDDAAAVVAAAARQEPGPPGARSAHLLRHRRPPRPARRLLSRSRANDRRTAANVYDTQSQFAACRACGINRRVRNDRMLAELHVQLSFPDYRAGLAAILGGCG